MEWTKSSLRIYNKAAPSLENTQIGFPSQEKIEVDIWQSTLWFLSHDSIGQQGSDHRPCNNSEVSDLRLGKQSWAYWSDFYSSVLGQKLHQIGSKISLEIHISSKKCMACSQDQERRLAGLYEGDFHTCAQGKSQLNSSLELEKMARDNRSLGSWESSKDTFHSKLQACKKAQLLLREGRFYHTLRA